jgi:hypothetical protein
MKHVYGVDHGDGNEVHFICFEEQLSVIGKH